VRLVFWSHEGFQVPFQRPEEAKPRSMSRTEELLAERRVARGMPAAPEPTIM
jgi:hypothetical protein